MPGLTSSWRLRFAAARTPSSPLSIEKTTADPATGLEWTDVGNGLALLTILPADTAGMADDLTDLVWDLQLESPAGSPGPWTIADGRLLVQADVVVGVGV